MGIEENKATMLRITNEVFNKGNVSAIDELVAADFVDHASPPGVPGTRDALKGFVTMYRAAFPDLHITLKAVIAEGDKVVQYATVSGTMKGDFAGMTASGKSATWDEIHISRIANGKNAEHWMVTDQMSMLAQLGFVQAPGQPVSA